MWMWTVPSSRNNYCRLSRPAQGRDATLSFGMKGTVSLPFFPLSPGEGYHLRHWSLVAEEKGVGGTPSFHYESVAVLFSTLPDFWDLSE